MQAQLVEVMEEHRNLSARQAEMAKKQEELAKKQDDLLKQQNESAIQQTNMARTQADIENKQDEMSCGIKALLEMMQQKQNPQDPLHIIFLHLPASETIFFNICFHCLCYIIAFMFYPNLLLLLFIYFFYDKRGSKT